jgi:hypothetical protein
MQGSVRSFVVRWALKGSGSAWGPMTHLTHRRARAYKMEVDVLPMTFFNFSRVRLIECSKLGKRRRISPPTRIYSQAKPWSPHRTESATTGAAGPGITTSRGMASGTWRSCQLSPRWRLG